MALLCGVEDAGRGPVIGPLVMCGVLISKEDEPKLKEMGCKDSKMLSPLQRERIAERIKEFAIKWEVRIVPPKEIDDAVNGLNNLNLNWLEAVKSVEIINALKPDLVVLDCPSTNIPAYRDYIVQRLDNKNMEVHAEHKADVNHPVVSAASIIAKVTRDEEIEKLKKKINLNFGSGYPSDPTTVGFLKKFWDKHPDIFRHTWAPYKKIVAQQWQKKLG